MQNQSKRPGMRTVKILIILVLLFPAGSAAAPAPSTGGTTNWLDTFDEWVGPRDMSMYNPPIETPERASITEEVARQHPGLILLDENVTLTFPEIPSATVSGQPSGPAVDVVMTDPVYFSPVPAGNGYDERDVISKSWPLATGTWGTLEIISNPVAALIKSLINVLLFTPCDDETAHGGIDRVSGYDRMTRILQSDSEVRDLIEGGYILAASSTRRENR